MIKYIKVFSNKPDNFRQFSLVFQLNGGVDFNHDMKIQLLFLYSYVLGSVFHEDKVSSLITEGVFAQRRSFMKATYRR